MLLTLGFPSAPIFTILTLPVKATRRTVLQKVRGSTYKVVPQLVNTGFQVLFHSPPGVLFTFPSRYCFTIGHQLVFSLGWWSTLLPTRFHVPRGTLDTSLPLNISLTGLLPSMVSAFQLLILLCLKDHYASPQPRKILLSFGLGSSAFARHYLRNLG